MKKSILLFFIFFNLANANNNSPDVAVKNTSTNTNNNISPDVAAQNIINSSLNHLKIINKVNKNITINDVKKLIKEKFLPLIDINFSASQTLKSHWNKLNSQERKKIVTHITNSLINDYAGFLVSYKDFDSIKITADIRVKLLFIILY